jgi:hypothetical protein
MSHLHLFIDDCTRYVPHGEFYFRQNLPCLEDCFRKAVLKGGVPPAPIGITGLSTRPAR